MEPLFEKVPMHEQVAVSETGSDKEGREMVESL